MITEKEHRNTHIRREGSSMVLTLPGFSLAGTVDCGQCFRFEKIPQKAISADVFFGIAGDRAVLAGQEGNDITFYNTNEDEFYEFWYNYFDLDTDYEKLKKIFAADPVMRDAVKFAGGIRVLRQQPWETLCSFIISQNNNIPRIKGIIQRLCENFGNRVHISVKPDNNIPAHIRAFFRVLENSSVFSFPSYKRISALTDRDLSVIRAGFREKYIFDAARKLASGEISLAEISKMSSQNARQALMKIKGVGPKVAECTLLFGFARTDAFPVDVWISRALKQYYADGFPVFIKPYAGIAQQILFHYIRNNRT
ncbi:MAG: DNA-3-methyladenine glycosylase 2 family protein [Oscillospiraceae bacterium]|nr:DNA-3-methyladenine glycosylase 2 family protein [Oscillospiraceae bacterium]